MKRPCPAVDVALGYLQKHFAGEKLHPGQRLPTVREIARLAGVSPPTLCKALAIHREQEQLSVSSGRGIVVGTELPPPQAGPADRAEEVALSLMRDIAIGTYSKQPFLPSCKELQEIHGTGFSTMSRALQTLVKKGSISRYKRRYAVRSSTGRKAGLSILLFLSPGLFDQIEKWGFLRSRIYPLLYAMEHDCVRRNIKLTIRSLADASNALREIEGIVGIGVLIEPHFPPVEQSQALVRRLLRTGLPFCLFDGVQSHAYGDLPLSRSLYTLEYFGEQQGYEMGRFLIEHGHRRMCYFAHEPGVPWSDIRLQGLQKAFDEAGFTNAVSAFYTANPLRIPIARGMAANMMPVLSPVAARRMRAVDLHIASLQKAVGASVFLDRAISWLEEVKVNASGTWARFTALCEKALDTHDATAWVAAHDHIALFALLPFLRRWKIGVPQRISVAGFDNVPESLNANLTTYDLDVPSAGLTVIDLFLFPDRRHAYTMKGNIIKRRGFIIDRGSVGRLGGRGPGNLLPVRRF